MKTLFLTLLALLVAHGSTLAAREVLHGPEDGPVQPVLDDLSAGDRVKLAPGIYREKIRVSAQGTEDSPVVIESADPSNPAIFSGADLISGWKALAGSGLPESGHPSAGKIFYADLDWVPKSLFVGSNEQKMARSPNSGWFPATVTDGQIISSTGLESLKDLELGGAQIFFFLRKGVVQTVAEIRGWSGTPGAAIELTEPLFKREMQFTDGDRFYVKNHAALIDVEGEWAVKPTEGGARIFWWPATPDLLALAEAPRREEVIDISNSTHVKLSGLHVRHAAPSFTGFGIGSAGAGKGKPVEGLVIEACSIYQNQRFGVYIKSGSNLILRNSLVTQNEIGACFGQSRRVLVEENQIAANLEDGLILSWDVEDVVVRRNAIHHHNRFAHPDNLQTFRGVKNVTIEDNVFLAGGQGAHTQQTVDVVVKNNLWIGTAANCLFVSDSEPDAKNTGTDKDGGGFTIERNTFSLNAGGAAVVFGPDHTMAENIFDVRGGTYAYGGKFDVSKIQSSNNLFWMVDNPKNLLASSASGRYATLESLQSVGLEAGSVFQDPNFAKVPHVVLTLNGEMLASNSESTLHLERAGIVSVGDNIEVNFDGINRVVKSVDGPVVTFEPPLHKVPLTTEVVSVWGETPVSPMSFKSESQRGSKIDFESFIQGDFNGDGQRDLPPWPAGIAAPRQQPEKF